MKFNVALAVAGVASAQSIGSLVASIPSCALSCLQKAIGTSGCSITDYACQCAPSTKAKITASATPCLLNGSSCSTSQLQMVQSITNQICAKALAGGSSGGSSAAASSAPASSAAAKSSAPVYKTSAAASSAAASKPAKTPAQASTPAASPTPASTPAQYTGAAAKVAPGAAALLAVAAFAL